MLFFIRLFPMGARQKNEAPIDLTPSVTIHGATVGVRYALLRFDSPHALESASPNADIVLSSGQWSHRLDFVASADVETLLGKSGWELPPLRSNGAYFFRCVPVPSGHELLVAADKEVARRGVFGGNVHAAAAQAVPGGGSGSGSQQACVLQ